MVSAARALAGLALLAAACAAPAREPSRAASEPAPAPASTLAQQPAIELRLPVEGAWIVSQGYHGAVSHRGRAAYALDLVKLDERGRAYAAQGKRTHDWYGFGAEVLASADGEVVRATDRFADNRVWGRGKDANSLIVRHEALFTEYVHLQRGSLRVRVGERVKRGQVLARAGNSGAETPHLHWAVLSSIDPIRTQPTTLAHYELRGADGAWQAASGTPREGETIRHRSP